MMRFWICFSALLALLSSAELLAQPAHQLMPVPAEMRWGKGRLSLKTPLKLQLQSSSDPIVEAAARRLLARLQGPKEPATGPTLQIRYGRLGSPEKVDEERYS